jgi:ABC-2 type transport system ATP-binding protein
MARRLFIVHGTEPRRLRDALRPRPEVTRASLFGDAVHVITHGDVPADALLAFLRDAGHAVRSIEAVSPSLEDVFIELMSHSKDNFQ